MRISLLSRLRIQENKALVDTYQDRKSGKFGYAITYNKKENYKPILTHSPIYDSRRDAFKAGTELRKQLKGLDC